MLPVAGFNHRILFWLYVLSPYFVSYWCKLISLVLISVISVAYYVGAAFPVAVAILIVLFYRQV